MKILSIETSCEHASVALLLNDETVERRLEGHANHSEFLLPTLRRLLDEAGIGLGGLNAIAFGAGPGAFTGVRLACGVAQGLALGADLGVVPICSLAALARQVPGRDILALADARMGEVYSAAYRRGADETLAEIQPPACTPPDAVIAPEGTDWFAAGSALTAYEAPLRAALAGRTAGWDGTVVPRAGAVALLAEDAVRRGDLLPAELAAPLYVRDKVALTTAERLARGGRA